MVALARTPSKLRDQMKSNGIDEATLSSHLTIVQGNAHSVEDVKKTITASNALPALVVSGMGGAPIFKFEWRKPFELFTLDNPNVCENFARTVLAAMGQIYSECPSPKQQKPVMVFVSTTGISQGAEDVPFGLRLLYHHALAIPHVDKRMQESAFRENMASTNEDKRLFRNIIGIRPTLLFGSTKTDDAIGASKIRAGTEDKPAVGYSIKRADVGEWMFRNLIENAEERAKWEGHFVSLTS